jgi:hypothetical protein
MGLPSTFGADANDNATGRSAAAAACDCTESTSLHLEALLWSEPNASCLRRYEATTTRRAPIDALTPAGLAVRLIDKARAAFIDGTLGTALGVDVSELKGAPRPRLEPSGSGLVGPADVKPVRPTLSPVPREATLSPVTSEAQGSQARCCPAAAPPYLSGDGRSPAGVTSRGGGRGRSLAMGLRWRRPQSSSRTRPPLASAR